MKTLKRDGDYWLVLGLMGEEHARLETNSGITELIVVQYNTIKQHHGDDVASWWLDGMAQGICHCTMVSMKTGKPLTVYESPGEMPPPGESEGE